MKIRWIFAAFIWCLALTPLTVASESLSPLETIKGPIDRVVSILNEPGNHSGDRKTEKRNQIWETVKPLFDFETLSRRVLGSDWERFSTEEQSKFQDVFAEFLANTYIDKIQGDYNNEKITFVDELVRDQLALARTKLVRESLELPIDYRMRQIDGNWKIYDILVENGVSLVKNYRVQFKSALQKETPAELIKRLQAKLKNN
jgi:phospholipid transport system substrate-binding protein